MREEIEEKNKSLRDLEEKNQKLSSLKDALTKQVNYQVICPPL